MALEFYEDYDRLIRLACPNYDYCLELIAKSIPPNVNSVLDIGSGSGNLILSILKNHSRIKIYGIEAQQSLVEIAKAKIRDPNVRFIQGDILSFGWPSAECITSSLTIHHFTHEQKEKVFRKVYGASSCFLYFDRLKGRNETEERQNLEYLFGYMRKNGLSEGMIQKAKEEIAKNDNPLTLKELNGLLKSIGFRYDILYLKHGFGLYFCTKKE